MEGRQQRQTYRSTEWNLAIDRSLLDQTFCWCSPKGRGDRLKIGTVGVRIPPPAPACCIRLSPRLVSRRRLHQPDAANLRAANFSQRRPAPRHRRSSSSDFAPCPEARRARPHRPSCGRQGLLGRVAVDAAAAREGQETFAAHRARTVAREARRLTPRSVRPRLHSLRWLSTSAHRQRQELSGIRVLQPVERHSQSLRLDVPAARDSA